MNDPLFDMSDRVVLVTGGSRGLGAAISLGLAQRGARVIIASRKLSACQELAARITEAGGHPTRWPATSVTGTRWTPSSMPPPSGGAGWTPW
jgi:NAD(P)-dependent dehydrogenase (short-subunit alcohol dehydrogenase family)